MRQMSRQNLAIAASIVALLVIGPVAFKAHQSGVVVSLRPAIRSDATAPQQMRPSKDVPEKLAADNPAASSKFDVGSYPGAPESQIQPSTLGVGGDLNALGPIGDAKAPSPQAFSGSGLAISAATPPQRYLPAPSPIAPRMSGQMLGFDAGTVSPGASANMPARRLEFDADKSGTGYFASKEESGDASSVGARKESRDIFNAPELGSVKQVASEPVSTFSFDVDTASYSFTRRALNAGHLPPKEAIRVEEMINYFPYAYPAPETAETPFKPTVTILPCPWKPTNKLVHVAIKGYDLKRSERPRANLVFLLDVSGSMEGEDRLPLVKNALRLLIDQLQPDDTVGIVTYASGSGIALEPTKIADKNKILAAIDKLEAGGSTDGADGIEDAYRLAEAGFDKGAVNRIILATDGDFNVGITDRDQLKSYIERKRKTGIYLSILGVGRGNQNDALMQALAQNGNGTAAYVDTLNEARKVLVDEASSTLFTIAKDVKAQVEWNPARVSEYRLIGYETRALKREDFNNDQVDAGDIGSGHTVTAIYEIAPVGAPHLVDDLRYGKAAVPANGAGSSQPSAEFGFLKLRYKKPNEDSSQLLSLPITDGQAKVTVDEAPQDARFAIAVAAFGDLLRGAPFVNGFSYDDVLSLAQTARGEDPYGYRAEFLNLVRLAKSARP